MAQANVQHIEDRPNICRRRTQLDTVVERGMEDGSKIKFERMSEQRLGFILAMLL